MSLWFDHRDGAGLQQRGHDTDGVGAAHRVGTIGLANDEASIGLRIERWEHQIGTALRSTAWLETQELANRVVDLIDVAQLVAHRRTGYIEHGAEVAGSLLAFGVHPNGGVMPLSIPQGP